MDLAKVRERQLRPGPIPPVNPDESIGQFLTDLGRLGVLDDTLIVLVADHGEEFHDHGRFSHGRTLYDEVTHVPLIIRLPGGDEGGRHVMPLARQIDILPTVLAQVGVPVPDHVDGHSLGLEEDGALPERHEAFSQTNLGGPSLEAVEVEGWKIIENAGRVQGGVEVYDLGADPKETHNLADGAPLLVGYGEQRLAEWRTGAWRPTHRPGVTQPQLDGNTRERLRALGYVD
ncbi:MAG TPA: sulfatase-like hydrolase/transferase [Candidatus Binatus sp.]|nr:sulfatase-like hydrolase/transferase [Candidatus Binatus sp.]